MSKELTERDMKVLEYVKLHPRKTPVPSYDEYNELATKCNQLQKRLEIATRALKKYKEDYFITEYGGRSTNPCPDIARKALKEMEGVK